MIIDQILLDDLSTLATANPWLKLSYDNCTNPNDGSQRMLNILELDTIMPIHRHRNTFETMVMVRSRLFERFYDNKGNITEKFIMEPCGQSLIGAD